MFMNNTTTLFLVNVDTTAFCMLAILQIKINCTVICYTCTYRTHSAFNLVEKFGYKHYNIEKT